MLYDIIDTDMTEMDNMTEMEHGANRVLFHNSKEALQFAETHGYKTTKKISDIPDGAYYYEVNTNNQFIGNRKKKNANSRAESTAPLFIISDDIISPDSLVYDLEPTNTGGRRKSRKNRRKSRKNRRKSRKNRRKSRKNRH